MKLSMEMLRLQLVDYHPESHIEDDGLTITGARFLPDSKLELHTSDLFFGSGDVFFDYPEWDDAYLVMHRHSYMVFHGCEYHELFNAILSIFDYYNDWESRMQNVALRGAPLEEFVDIAFEAMGNPLEVESLGRGGKILACSELGDCVADPYWRYGAVHGTYHPAVYDQAYYDAHTDRPIRSLSSQPQLVRNVYPGGDPVIMCYIEKGGEAVGSLCVLQEKGDHTAMNMQLAPLIARYFAQGREFSAPSGSARSKLSVFRDVLVGNEVGDENMQLLADALPNEPWRLGVFEHASRSDEIANQHLVNAILDSDALSMSAAIGESVYAIVSDGNCRRLSRDYGWNLDLSGWRVGLSMPGEDASMLPIRKEQARFALDQSPDGPCVGRCEDFAFDLIVKHVAEDQQSMRLLHPSIETLRRYDAQTNSSFLETLEAYVWGFTNSQLTAELLHIHPNTLKYRLNRIRDLCGITLRDEEELRYLMLSVWLDKARLGSSGEAN